MSFSFPQFDTPNPLAGGSSWVAVFDSYDQRNDDVYYVIIVRDGQREVARFMAQVGLWWAGNDWTGPGFVERLRKELEPIASSGRSNTSYRGSL